MIDIINQADEQQERITVDVENVLSQVVLFLVLCSISSLFIPSFPPI